MIIKIDTQGTVENLENITDELSEKFKCKSILILSCDNNQFNQDSIDSMLKKFRIPVFGGIFPAIINGNTIMERGSIVAGIFKKVECLIIENLSSPQEDYESILLKNIHAHSSMKTMFVFVDFYSRNITAFIDSLFNIFGLGINYIGGGAGTRKSLNDQIVRPCLFTNRGLIKDGAVLAMSELESSIGMRHGWEYIDDEFFRVTESDHRYLSSLDWESAYRCYKEYIENHTGKSLPREKDKFYEIAKEYPLGIQKIGSEMVLRSPLSVADDEKHSLFCGGEIQKNSLVKILALKGNSKEEKCATLCKAVQDALDISEKNFPHHIKRKRRFFIDCISRKAVLEEMINRELQVVYENDHSPIGAFTFGEIANTGSDYLEFYNKTAVIATIEDN